jgi:hypothetical protein
VPAVLHKVNARDIIVEASDGAATPTWVEIGGLTSVTINEGENEETADTTTYASRGAHEQDIMQRGATMSLEGLRLADDVTGALDPGQAQVVENAGLDRVGVLSHSIYRFRWPMDAEWTVWDATTSLGERGGGNNDKVGFAATLTRSGPSSSEAVA